MRILYRYSPYTLDFTTGEKYYCYPSDANSYLIYRMRYLGDITNVSTTSNLYDPSYDNYSSLNQMNFSGLESFYRCMADKLYETGLSRLYRSVWGRNETSSSPGTSTTIIKRLYSSTTITVHILIMADNYFQIYKNNTLYLNTLPTPLPSSDPASMFSALHIFPIELNAGYTELKFIGTQGGSGVSNALGVLVLGNTIEEILGVNYTSNTFDVIEENNWDVLYTSDDAITEGVYFNYGTSTITLANYLGITPQTNIPPSIITSYAVNWGDGSALQTGTIPVDLTKHYSSTGTYTVSYTIYLTNGGSLTTSKNITVT